MTRRDHRTVRRLSQARSAHTLLEILVVVALLGVLGAVVLPSVASMVSGGNVKVAHETLVSALDEARTRARRANACLVLVLDSSRGAPRIVLRTAEQNAADASAGRQGLEELLATLPESVTIGWAPAAEESSDRLGAMSMDRDEQAGADAADQAEKLSEMELCLVLPDGSLAPSGPSRQMLRLSGRSGVTQDVVLGRWRGSDAPRAESAELPSADNTATEASPSVRPVVEAPVEPVGGPRDEEQDLLDP